MMRREASASGGSDGSEGSLDSDASSYSHDDDIETNLASEDDIAGNDMGAIDRENKKGGGSYNQARTAKVKLGVFLTLCIMSMTVCLMVAFVSTEWEMERFRRDFADDASRLLEHVGVQGRQNLEAMASLGTFLTSFGATQSSPSTATSSSAWPFVTVPTATLESQAAHTMRSLKTSQLYVSPLVQAGIQRETWELYTKELALEQGFGPIAPSIYKILPGSESGQKVPEDDLNGPFSPVWQIVPTTSSNQGDIMYNLASLPSVARAIDQVYERQESLLTAPVPLNETEAEITQHLSLFSVTPSEPDEPVSLLIHPIFEDLETETESTFSSNQPTRKVVAVAVAPFLWKSYLMNAFGSGTRGFLAVFQSACGDEQTPSTFTYQIDENHAQFMGAGDMHHKFYDNTAQSATLTSTMNHDNGTVFETSDGISMNQDFCPMTITCYATAIYQNQHLTSGPIFVTVTVVCIFSMTLLLFLIYGGFTESRLTRLTKRAERTTRLVNTLFPKEIQDRMFKNGMDDDSAQEAVLSTVSRGDSTPAPGVTPDPLSKIKTFLKDKQGEPKTDDMPIADLYPNCTVLFADIVGFTAWSSRREPAQVFILLEKVYKSFDDIAKRRGVFKVETIGDCYVAVVGLPSPNKSHAVVMTRFARDCRDKMAKVTRDLELTLGPDTGDLQCRIGLHSGPVTAGVLRGERSRFQLFGDTVNTTARVESTGAPSKIHISASTAELLIAAGKQQWVTEREELVHGKGKGMMRTFWADPRSGTGSSSASTTAMSVSSSGASDNDGFGDEATSTEVASSEIIKLDSKTRRLVNWNVQVMAQHIRKIVAFRASTTQGTSDRDRSSSIVASSMSNIINITQGTTSSITSSMSNIINMNKTSSATATATATATADNMNKTSTTTDDEYWNPSSGSNTPRMGGATVIDEVKEVVDMPEGTTDPLSVKEIELSETVMQQLDQFVTCIAAMYPNNPFHDFDHASNVTMSVVKLLSRIIAPNSNEAKSACHDDDISSLQASLANNPLTQFACVFAALTHDVQHPGVSNSVLVKENSPLAQAYKDKSVAEQNSVDMSWDLLQQEEFRDLRRTICATNRELRQFRQLYVNAVMATDIMDKDLKALRNARWERAFGEQDGHNHVQGIATTNGGNKKEAINRKATIVIEHLLQASDVAHTMQHWHVYRKWNEKLFREMYKAYKAGRLEQDPAKNWYKGEIGFFDFYIIPLAKKLSDCGVFGVSSDEYLSYANSNRNEWEQRGQEITEAMIEKVNNEAAEAAKTAAAAAAAGGDGASAPPPRSNFFTV